MVGALALTLGAVALVNRWCAGYSVSIAPRRGTMEWRVRIPPCLAAIGLGTDPVLEASVLVIGNLCSSGLLHHHQYGLVR